MSTEVIQRSAKWIPWGNDFGNQGLYPAHICEVFQNSKTLRACLTQQAALTAAELGTANELLQTKIDRLCTPHGESLRSVIQKVALDFLLHGEGFIKETRFIEYAGDTPIKERSFSSHVDASHVRFGSDVTDELEVVSVYLSANWEHYSRKEYRPKKYPLFRHGYLEHLDENGRVFKKECIHRLKSTEPGMNFYGRGDFVGAFYDAKLEHLLPRWNMVHILNSIHLSGILNVEMPFAPDEDTAKEIRDRIRENLKTEHVGGPSTPIQITGGDGKMELISYALPSDGSFKELSKTCERNIIMACGWHPALMGIQTPGQLGQIREIEQHHKRAMEYQIKPLQQRILETYMSTLYGTEYFEYASQSPINFQNKPLFTALDYVSQSRIDQVIPDDVLREELGLTDDNE